MDDQQAMLQDDQPSASTAECGDRQHLKRCGSLQRVWDSLPRLSKAFLGVAVGDACLVTAFVVQQLCTAQGELLHILLLMLVATVFFVLFSWDAIAHENTQELQAAAVLAAVLAARMLFYTVRKTVRNLTAGLLVVAVLAVLLATATLALAYATYTQFGWRQYSKLACDMRRQHAEERRRLLVQMHRYTTLLKLHFLSLAALFVVVMVVAVREKDHIAAGPSIMACATFIFVAVWEAVAWQAICLEKQGLILALEVVAIVIILLPLANIGIVYQSVGGASHVNAQASLVIAAVAVTLLTVMVVYYMHVLSASFGLLVDDILPDFGHTHTELIPLMQGAWLGKPCPAAPHKRRFFQLSADGSTLRWAWNKFVLLYYIQGLRLDPETHKITLEMNCDPDLCLKFDGTEQYEIWKLGLTGLLQLLFTPSPVDATNEGPSSIPELALEGAPDAALHLQQGAAVGTPSKLLQKFGIHLSRPQSGTDIENQRSLSFKPSLKELCVQPVATSTPAKLLGLLRGSPRKCPLGPDGEPLSPAIGTSIIHINAYAVQERDQAAPTWGDPRGQAVVHHNPSFHPDGSPESDSADRASAYDTALESPSTPASSPFALAPQRWQSPLSGASSPSQQHSPGRSWYPSSPNRQQLSRFGRPPLELGRYSSPGREHGLGSPCFLAGSGSGPVSPSRGLHASASMPSSLSLQSCGSGDSSPGRAGPSDGSLQMAMVTVPYEELVVGKHLGRGAQGEVWAAWYADTPVAVKHTCCASEVTMNLLVGLHDNILGLRALTTAPESGATALVLEYCPRGTLDTLIHQRAPGLGWALDRLVSIVRGIVRGMLHLHTRNPPILHRDLKPANVFIGNGFVMKIGDFGMSRTVGGDTAHRALFAPQTGFAGGIVRQLTPGTVGTVAYAAPEILALGFPCITPSTQANLKKLLAADVYSFGVTLWEVLERKRPYGGMDAVLLRAQFSLDDQPPPRLPPVSLPESLSEGDAAVMQVLAELVVQCTDIDPAMRPTFKEISSKFRAMEKSGTLLPN